MPVSLSILSPSCDRDWLFHGLRLRSPFAHCDLPELAVEGEADLHLLAQPVSRALTAPVWRSPFVEVSADGSALFHLAGLLRVLVVGGRGIRVEASATATIADLEMLLAHSVAAALCYQRAESPLHASCVMIGGRAVALCGPAGRGKSTVAAALVAAGFPLISDNLCRVRLTDAGPQVSVGPHSLNLWPEAISAPHALGLEANGGRLLAGRRDHPKRRLGLPMSLCAPPTESLPLAAIVRLRVDGRCLRPQIMRRTGADSLARATDLLMHPRLAPHLGEGLHPFVQLAQILALVPQYTLDRTGSASDLDQVVGLLRGLGDTVP